MALASAAGRLLRGRTAAGKLAVGLAAAPAASTAAAGNLSSSLLSPSPPSALSSQHHQQSRRASGHAENTNTFIREVRETRALFAPDTIEEKEKGPRRGAERERGRKKETEKGMRIGKRKPRRPVALFFFFFFFPRSTPLLKKPFPTKKKKKKHQALLQLEYPDKLQRLLLTPQREVLVELVITRDNGEIEVKKRRESFFFFFFDFAKLRGAQKKKKRKKNLSKKKKDLQRLPRAA